MRLAIVEDEELTRELLVLLLGTDPSVVAVEAYASAEEALARLGGFTPEVLLVDLALPGMHGIELIRRVRQSWPGTKIVVTTISEDRAEVVEAIKAGASGYFLKGSPTQELRESLDTLQGEGASMSPRIARMLLLELQNTAEAAAWPLSDLESAILRAVAQGTSSRELAEAFQLSQQAVYVQIKNVYRKFHPP